MTFTMSKDTENGRELWERVTRDIRKLSAAEKASAVAPKLSRFTIRNPVSDVVMPQGFELPSGGGIDRKTEDRLRKGDIRIESRLDLHGYNLTTAKEKLLQFVAQNFAANKRTLLVITGKGRRQDQSFHAASNLQGMGAIKREFTLWLEDPAIKACILSSSVAQPKHGGSGAYYIYLRKKR